MARGVDTAPHRGTISGKGKTVAMFGTGVDVLYPKENSRLAEQILAHGGALVSEFPLGTFAAPQNFSIRNRVMSGISVGVLVVEAAEYSGPHHAKTPGGPNTLIKQGAKLDATWEDVWEELPQDVRLALTPPAGAESQAGHTASLFEEPSLSPHEKRIYSVLKADEAMHLDEIIDKLEPNLSSSEIFAALFELELAGRVKQLPGKNFVRSF